MQRVTPGLKVSPGWARATGWPPHRISTRVRMMQPHGGTTEGFHFPLRKGTEVMIAFLGGDPDRQAGSEAGASSDPLPFDPPDSGPVVKAQEVVSEKPGSSGPSEP